MTADPRNFLVNTDYPMDKIIYMNSGSFTATTSGLGDIDAIEHGLPYRPHIAGSWSLNSDFSTSKEFYIPTYADLDGVYVECYTDDTYVRIYSQNYSGSNKTIYWRIYGFMPSGITETASSTSSLSSDFVFNTDYNYSKLWYSDLIPYSASPTVVTHNFGYRPQIMAWWKDASTSYGDLRVNNNGFLQVTDTTVSITSPLWDTYLMIYADSQT